MPIYRDKTKGCFVFEFDRRLEGKRIRTRKHLPKTWNKSQADAFDRQESARLYAIATNVERAQYSIEEAVDIYLKERVPHLKSGKNIGRELAQMFFAYQGRPITTLPDACRFYTAKATRLVNEEGQPVEPLAPATLRNRIRYLTAACRYGWKWHNMCEHDPAERVLIPEVKNERQFYSDRLGMISLVRACKNWPTRAAIRRAFYSGMRISEILRAVRVGNTFVLDDTKNGEPRIVPIHPKVMSIADKQLLTQSNTARHWREARKAVGMTHLHFHDLRHSAASEMINNDVDLYTVGAVLGHKSGASTKRYAHLATKALTAAIGKIGKKKVA